MNDDLNELMSQLDLVSKSHTGYTHKIKELESTISLLKEEIRTSQGNEQFLRSHLSRKQQNLKECMETILKLSTTKEEYEKLVKDYKNLEEIFEEDQKKIEKDKESWLKEKEQIQKEHEEYVENMKNIRNMEGFSNINSLNREMTLIKEDNKRVIENLQNEIRRTEELFKKQFSQTITSYEEKIIQLNGDLTAAQTEMKNLRQKNTTPTEVYLQNEDMDYGKIEREKTIYRVSRYQPLPIISTASQMYSSTHNQKNNEEVNKEITNVGQKQNIEKKVTFPTVKKRKLYTRTDDIV